MPNNPLLRRSAFVPMGMGNTQDGRSLGGIDPRLTRTNYFDGRLLKASDLVRDQMYLDARAREVGRALGSGVASGLWATLDDQRITVQPGLAISPSGRVLELTLPLTVDLDERAEISVLNFGTIRGLNRGLYAVALRFVEKGVDTAEVYPQDPAERREFHYNAYQEGVELVLVQLRAPLPNGRELRVRAGLSRSLLRNQGQPSELPDDAVALALLAVESERAIWMDQRLVRRELTPATAENTLQRNLRLHYEELLSDVLALRNSSSLAGDFPATLYFPWLPPCGPIPKGSVDPMVGRQGYFPDHYRVSVAPIRVDDLAQVEEECLSLPALDLRSEDGAEILVLAPLSDADFTWHGRRLERSGANLPHRALPFLDPLRLRLRPAVRPHQLDTDEAVWRDIWDRITDTDLRYVRRPAQLAESRVSAVVLARGFDLPPPGQALPEVQELTAQLADARAQVTSLQSQLSARDAAISSLNKQVARLKAELLAASEGGADGSLTLSDALGLRATTVRQRTIATEVFGRIGGDRAQLQQVLALFELTPAIYDEAMWLTVAAAVRAAQLPALLKLVQKAVGANANVPKAMLSAADTFGLSPTTQELWKRLAAEDPNNG